jgi:glycosyltransferase involved in cell wall biosynthesis
VHAYLHRAAAVVVPLRIGGGTRLKIYEAMAAAKAVVSTTIGAEGLDVVHGRDIILADAPDTFAAGVVRLLTNAADRRCLEDAALALASRYDWARVTDSFADVLAQVVIAERGRQAVA